MFVSGMEDDFRPPIFTVVKVLISRRSVIKLQLVRDDERGLCAVMFDQSAQATIVMFYVGLTRAHELALEPEFTHVKADLAFLCQIILGLWVFWDEHTYYPQATRCSYRGN